MPFEIVRNNIVNMQVDAIVNTANPKPVIGAGTDIAVHEKAGWRLLWARKRLGNIAVGEAAVTPAYKLDAKYVIHAVGPMWQGGAEGEEALLAKCYENALRLAVEHHCESVAFPLISAGSYRFPGEIAMRVAVQAISGFLMEHELQVYLVVFDKNSVGISEKLFAQVKSYVDEHYVEEQLRSEYGPVAEDSTALLESECLLEAEETGEQWRTAKEPEQRSDVFQKARSGALSENRLQMPTMATRPMDSVPEETRPVMGTLKQSGQAEDEAAVKNECPVKMPAQVPVLPQPMEDMHLPKNAMKMAQPQASRRLEDLMKELEETFSQALLRLIDEKGKKDPEVYKKANVDRKLFSKIRNNINYQPSKSTALAFAVALELNLDETKDLIGRAGYALSRSSKFDVIVEYFIVHKNYDIFELNEVLFAFEQPIIGG